MSETVLLRFLGSGLVDVGGDDAKLGKLQATSNAIALVLKKVPSKVPNYCLVAFDSNAPSADPVVVEVLNTLKELWPTYVNTFASTPITVLRAIILDALVEAAREDERVAVAFSASARNIFPFMETGNELSIWADVVDEIEATVDSRAEQEWATPASIQVGQLQIDTIQPIKIANSSVTVNRDSLKQKFTTAAQGNGVYPQNNPGQWAQNFGNSFSDVVAEILDDISAKAKVAPVDLTAPLQHVTTSVSSYMAQSMHAFSAATFGLQRRTNLIWWKQALFSPSKQKSYRAFPVTIASALMALDLYQQIPMFSPASVSAFLEEAVRSLPPSPNVGQRVLKDLLREACESSTLDVVRAEAAKLFPSPLGRSPILAVIAHPETFSALKDDELQRIIGVSLGVQISDPQWASWLFRDLQAGRSTKEQPKKRASKGTA
jgi:GTPase-associated system-like protein